jgi:DHA1 family multidrug resistance protein-like MFS transporter
MLRSGVAAAFPLFSVQVYEYLGVQYAGTLLAGLSVLMIPIPLLFRKYGAEIRRRSKLLSDYVGNDSGYEKNATE